MSNFKVTLNKNEVLEELKACNRVLDKKNNLTVTECIILEFNNNNLFFKGTDGVKYFTSFIPCNSNENVAFSVNRELLISTLNAVRKDTINLIKQDEKVYIQATNEKNEIIFNSFLYYFGTDDYPAFPNMDLQQYVSFHTSKLKSILDKTFCVAKDGSSAALNGVSIQKVGNEFKFISTDRHRLSYIVTSDIESNLDDFSIIVYNDLVSEIKRLNNSEVTLKVNTEDKSSIVLSNGNRQTLYPLINATFPDVTKIFSNSFDQLIKVKSSSMKNMIESVSFIATKNDHNLFKIIVKDSSVDVVASNNDVGVISTKVEDAIVEKELDIEMKLNNTYLKEVFGTFNPDDVIHIEFKDMKLTLYKENERDKYLHMVMATKNI